MKVSREQASANRAALVSAASRLFREHGIDGVGVAEIGKAAGLTHGALYAHFSSKSELAAAALSEGVKASNRRLLQNPTGELRSTTELLDAFLTVKHRDDMVGGCPAAASASEIARQDDAVAEAFSSGIASTVSAFEEALRRDGAENPRDLAITMVAAELGALVIARGVAGADTKFSERFLSGTRGVLRKLAASEKKGGAGRNARAKRPAAPTRQ